MKLKIKCPQPHNLIFIIGKNPIYEHGKISKQYRKIYHEKDIYLSTLVPHALSPAVVYLLKLRCLI